MLKDSFGSKIENENAGNTRGFSVQLPAHVADGVEQAALRKGRMVAQFLRDLATESVEERVEPLEVRLQRISGLIREIVVSTRKMAMQEEKDAKTGPVAGEERKKKRDHLVELGMEACDELRKISRSEEAAKEAEFRLQAFMVMARLGSFSAAVIRDQQAEDIVQFLAEVEEENERFDEKLKELEKKRREKEEEEKERWRTAAI